MAGPPSVPRHDAPLPHACPHASRSYPALICLPFPSAPSRLPRFSDCQEVTVHAHKSP